MVSFTVAPADRPSQDTEPVTTEEQGASDIASLPWAAAAKAYAAALRTGAEDAAPGHADAPPRIASVRAERDGRVMLPSRLQTLYRELSAGDVVVVDAAGLVGPESAGVSREQLALAFFESGFDCPMLWAGRKVLRAEPKRRWLGRLIGDKALGAGPRRFPALAAPLDPRADRIVAMARRSELPPPGERMLRLSVVMPVYNERATCKEVLDRLLSKTIPGVEIEVCIIESNSKDGTRDDVLTYADHPRVRLILEDKPSGKGHAVRRGLAAATGDFLLIQDADFEYDLDDYEKLLKPLRDGTSGFVLGSRHLPGETVWSVRQFDDQPTTARFLNLGHLIFTWMMNIVFAQKMRDPFTMFKVFRRDAIYNIRFECNRFDFDIELVGKLVRQGYSPLEVGIRYNSRSFKEGKKVSMLHDPPTWIKACLKHRFSTLHVWPEAG